MHVERDMDNLEHVQRVTTIREVLENICSEEERLKKPGTFRWSVGEMIRSMLITDFGRQCSKVGKR